jgi:O-antigen/teichoic acid export membrane protein
MNKFNIRNTIKSYQKYSIKSLLFDNKTIKQTIFKNTFWLTFGTIVAKLLKVFLVIYIARILGANNYGSFTFALAFVSLFGVFLDLGTSSITIRDLSQDKKKEKEFPAILCLRMLLGVGTLIIILTGSFFITPDPLIRKIIWILAIYSIIGGYNAILGAFFHARQRMEYKTLGDIINAILTTGIGLFILFIYPSVINLAWVYLFGNALVFLVIVTIFHFKFLRFSLKFNPGVWKEIIRISWPLAFTSAFVNMYNQTDSVMMGYWGQVTQTGWYNAAYRIIGVCILPINFISQSFYPALSKTFKKSQKSFQNIWDYQFKIIIFLSFPLVTGGISLAPKIINLIYDKNFFPATLAFQILLVTVIFIFFTYMLAKVLIITNQQKKFFTITLLGVIVNVIFNFLLIPKYSLYGAAIATLVTYIFVFLLLLLAMRFTPINLFKKSLFHNLLLVVISNILMYLTINSKFINNFHVLWEIIIGIFSYTFFFFIFKKIFKRIGLNF